jgi:hypothetical protein
MGAGARRSRLVLPLRFYLEDTAPDEPPVQIQLDTDDEPLVVEAAAGSATARVGRAADPDLVLSGPARPVGRLMLGRISLGQARRNGVATAGNTELLTRLRVRPPTRTHAAPASAVSQAP